MRKYEPIWIKIKETHKATISAPIHMHKRIKRGVSKEKDQDLGFKLLQDSKGLRYSLVITSNEENNLLHFELVSITSDLIRYNKI